MSLEIEKNDRVSDHGELPILIDSIPALVASIDCNMTIRYCNKPFLKWLGLRGDASGCSFADVTGKVLFQQVQRHMGTVLCGEPAHFEVSIDAPHRVRYLDVTLSPAFDEGETVKGFIFHGLDVTEKSKNERNLKDYFENASIGLHWVSADGVIAWANPSELKMLGYEAHEYIGHNIAEFHASEERIQEILSRLKSRQPIKNYEADLLCKDGTIRHVIINSSVLWEGDKFIHTRCFTADITEEKRALKAIEESEQRFRIITDLAPIIIWTTDKVGSCNFLSIRWKDYTGREVDEGLGDGWLQCIHPSDKGKIERSWKHSIAEKTPFEAKLRLINKDNQYTVFYISTNPRYDSHGLFLGFVGIMQDISVHEKIKTSLEQMVLDRTEDIRKQHASLQKAEIELQQKNEELQASNRQLESFAHVASHDLQEPLRKISTFSSRLFEVEGDKFSEQGKQFYNRIRESSERMQILIRDVLAYSKFGVKNELRQEVDLNELWQEVISELELKITDKHARIEKSALPAVRGMRSQFYQLFLNLLNNSLKFAKENEPPLIKVYTEVVDAGTAKLPKPVHGLFNHFVVEDNGIGFDPDFSEKIFEVFHRLNGRAQYEGSGIGLAICKRIVEDHGGFIFAESKINEGATFHIYLPLATSGDLSE